ncbi:MAG: hypothetical protein HN441_03240 [Candidatus Thioglobus sp.]|nr:hypothetical protein [Candidatus Thioglobus sp.]
MIGKYFRGLAYWSVEGVDMITEEQLELLCLEWFQSIGYTSACGDPLIFQGGGDDD